MVTCRMLILVVLTGAVMAACGPTSRDPYQQVASGSAAIQGTQAAQLERAQVATLAAQTTADAARYQSTNQAATATAQYWTTAVPQTAVANGATATALHRQMEVDEYTAQLEKDRQAQDLANQRRLLNLSFDATATAMAQDAEFDRNMNNAIGFAPWLLLMLLGTVVVAWVGAWFKERWETSKVVEVQDGYIKDNIFIPAYGGDPVDIQRVRQLPEPAKQLPDPDRDRYHQLLQEDRERRNFHGTIDELNATEVATPQLAGTSPVARETTRPSRHAGLNADVVRLVHLSAVWTGNPEGWYGRKIIGSRDVPGKDPNGWTATVRVMKVHGVVKTQAGQGTQLTDEWKNLMHLLRAIDTGRLNFNALPQVDAPPDGLYVTD